jgi:phospholipase/carboxylesterase
MAITLDGPRVAAKSSMPEQLVVFLHGYGANGNDLIAIGKQWRNLMPGAAFVAPNAPEPCAQAPGGRQWFRLTIRDPNERWTGVKKACLVLDAFLDAERCVTDWTTASWPWSASARTMLALHAGLRRAQAPAGILGYSGELVAPPEHRDQVIARAAGTPPPILLVHGSRDDVIPAERYSFGRGLAEAKIPVSGIFQLVSDTDRWRSGSCMAASFGQMLRSQARSRRRDAAMRGRFSLD